MKKLLFKWFPKFFTVNTTNYIDPKDLDEGDFRFKVYHVDPENEHMHEGLGITEERVQFFSKEVKRAILDSGNTIDAMARMAPHLKHANEFYLVSIMIYRQVKKMGYGSNSSKLDSLLAALLSGGNPPKEDN